MPKPGDVVAGKYLVDQLLGEGGMGAVFAATHRFTGKQVALKWMLPELARDEDAVQRFMREANAAGRISHPNVVDVYDVGQHEDSFFLVMEYLRGEPLTTALARQDMTVREVLELLLRAMRGVAAAHRQGVVHRDLKPDNIFLAYEEDGVRREPKVLDFGISKVAGSEGTINPRLTRTGAVVGTPYYMSPEQIRGSESLDKRADVYSFGVIMYEALTGQVPFTAETYGALVLEIATGTPRSPRELVPGLPVELSQIVLKAMARNASDRYPDMESLIYALDPFVTGEAAMREKSGQQPPRLSRSASGRPVTASSAVSTPFIAEPPVEEPPRFRSGGNTLLVVGAAAVAVVAIWFTLNRMRAPELPLVVTPPTSPAAASSAPASPVVPTATAPASVAPETAAAVPAQPAAPAENPFETKVPVPSAVASPTTPSSVSPETRSAPAAAAKPAPDPEPALAPPAARWRPRKRVEEIEPPPAPVRTQPVPAAEPPPPPVVASPPPVQVRPAPVRRARSGSLSVDEF